jgi:hypothetical protein
MDLPRDPGAVSASGHVTSLLDRPVYSHADVDRHLGLHSGTARRWLNGYRRGGRDYGPVLLVIQGGIRVIELDAVALDAARTADRRRECRPA